MIPASRQYQEYADVPNPIYSPGAAEGEAEEPEELDDEEEARIEATIFGM